MPTHAANIPPCCPNPQGGGVLAFLVLMGIFVAAARHLASTASIKRVAVVPLPACAAAAEPASSTAATAASSTPASSVTIGSGAIASAGGGAEDAVGADGDDPTEATSAAVAGRNASPRGATSRRGATANDPGRHGSIAWTSPAAAKSPGDGKQHQQEQLLLPQSVASAARRALLSVFSDGAHDLDQQRHNNSSTPPPARPRLPALPHSSLSPRPDRHAAPVPLQPAMDPAVERHSLLVQHPSLSPAHSLANATSAAVTPTARQRQRQHPSRGASPSTPLRLAALGEMAAGEGHVAAAVRHAAGAVARVLFPGGTWGRSTAAAPGRGEAGQGDGAEPAGQWQERREQQYGGDADAWHGPRPGHAPPRGGGGGECGQAGEAGRYTGCDGGD